MRYKGLDFLRGIAILGVMCRHLEWDTWMNSPGGFGVDLFFVLSGFLVSGLLFSEYKRKGEIHAGRFLLRRGFKIYPSFYFFLLFTIAFYWVVYKNSFPWPHVASELFFLQSYFTPMWMHTWSLAVEEHFYFLLVLFLVFAFKRKWLKNTGLMISIFTGCILLIMVLRIYYVLIIYAENKQPFFYTHLRIDGLITGALLGYFYHFHEKAMQFFRKKNGLFALLMFLFAAPIFFVPSGHPFMLTVGFNLFHVACAIAVLFSVSERTQQYFSGSNTVGKISGLVSAIGVYSYSIYLWHLPVQNILLRYIPNPILESAVYFFTAIAIGILVSKMIEQPMLRLRERYFPSR